MTRVEFNAGELSMRFKGHAGSDAAGRDLVCAAMSILMYTLIETVSNHMETLMPSIRMQDGEVEVRCHPSQGRKTMCRTILETVFTGCEILANEYPQFVQTIKIQEGE